MLHVLNGDCTAEAFAEMRTAAERRLVWRDILIEGPLGAEVLDGRQDRIAAVGIDHCVGGVHLDSRAGPLWRWDDERRRLLHER